MDKNVREAAELIRDYLSSCSMYSVPEENTAAWTLARAYLSEHPADDEEPFDKAYLVSLGGNNDWHPQKVTFKRPDCLDIGLWLVDDGWKVMLMHTEHAASCIVRGITTRRQFRDLARALAINLNETPLDT